MQKRAALHCLGLEKLVTYSKNIVLPYVLSNAEGGTKECRKGQHWFGLEKTATLHKGISL